MQEVRESFPVVRAGQQATGVRRAQLRHQGVQGDARQPPGQDVGERPRDGAGVGLARREMPPGRVGQPVAYEGQERPERDGERLVPLVRVRRFAGRQGRGYGLLHEVAPGRADGGGAVAGNGGLRPLMPRQRPGPPVGARQHGSGALA